MCHNSVATLSDINITKELNHDFVFLQTGLNFQVAQKSDEVDVLKEEIAKELSSALGNIRLAERGVYVQASTLGALEALLDFLKSSKIPVSFIYITRLFILY